MPERASIAFPCGNERQVRDVLHERLQQDWTWGAYGGSHDFETWLAILQEEIGEACAARLAIKFGPRGKGQHFRKELVQVAAVAMAMIECGDRNGWFEPEPTEAREDT